MGFPSKNPAPMAPAAAPPPAPTPMLAMNLAQLSAMGTTAGASAASVSKGPPAGSGMPGAGPANVPPGQDPNAAQAPAPPIGLSSRPVVAAHKGRSVGTHHSRSPNKRGNPVHGH